MLRSNTFFSRIGHGVHNWEEVNRRKEQYRAAEGNLPIRNVIRLFRGSGYNVGDALQKPQFALARLLATYAGVSAPVLGSAAFASASQPFR